MAEKKLGFKLLMSSDYGWRMRLTPEGKVLLGKFDKLQQDMAALFLRGSDKHSSCPGGGSLRDDLQRKYESQRKAAVLRSLRISESYFKTISLIANTA